MDIELPSPRPSWLSLFDPIKHFRTDLLYLQNVTLENTFFTHPHQHTNVVLTLINSTLLVSDSDSLNQPPKAALSFNFDLKFQILYAAQKNLRSTKKGIRLFYNDTRSFSFYSDSSDIVERWVSYLSQHLNQIGFHNLFKPSRKLGKGNFASVYEVLRVTDNQRFAVKAFSKQGCFNARNGKESLINQLNVMRTLSRQGHKNVLKLEGVYQSQNSIYMVMELLKGGQLLHKIHQRNGYFSPSQIKDFMRGLLQGLEHMHSKRLMHRDLKPDNIMLRPGNILSPVIVDFGLATCADVQKYLFYRCGTPGYVAPEIISMADNSHIEPQCDVFSAGVIFHILLTRRQVFQGSRYDQVYRKNKELRIQIQGQRYNSIDPQALDLLKKMLILDPKDRINSFLALKHPYFDMWQRIEAEEMTVNSPSWAQTSMNGVKNTF